MYSAQQASSAGLRQTHVASTKPTLGNPGGCGAVHHLCIIGPKAWADKLG